MPAEVITLKNDVKSLRANNVALRKELTSGFEGIIAVLNRRNLDSQNSSEGVSNAAKVLEGAL